MAETTQKLRFTWITTDGETKTMTLSHPNPNVTSAQAQAVLDAGVTTQPFAGVTLETGADAEIVESTTVAVEYTMTD